MGSLKLAFSRKFCKHLKKNLTTWTNPSIISSWSLPVAPWFLCLSALLLLSAFPCLCLSVFLYVSYSITVFYFLSCSLCSSVSSQSLCLCLSLLLYLSITALWVEWDGWGTYLFLSLLTFASPAFLSLYFCPCPPISLCLSILTSFSFFPCIHFSDGLWALPFQTHVIHQIPGNPWLTEQHLLFGGQTHRSVT